MPVWLGVAIPVILVIIAGWSIYDTNKTYAEEAICNITEPIGMREVVTHYEISYLEIPKYVPMYLDWKYTLLYKKEYKEKVANAGLYDQEVKEFKITCQVKK